MADVFQIKQHDTQPSLAATLSDDSGPVVIPSGATVNFVMRRMVDDCGCDGNSQVNAGLWPGVNGYCVTAPVPNTPKVNRQAVVVNGALGQVRYDWAAGDTDTAGNFSGEFKVSVAGAITTYPSSSYIPIYITPDLS